MVSLDAIATADLSPRADDAPTPRPGRERAIRVALLAAFPFPLPQGSQVFVAEQARALARAGCDVTLLCYGAGAAEQGGGGDDGGLAAAGVHVVRAARVLSRAPLRAGPSGRKPLADVALFGRWLALARAAQRAGAGRDARRDGAAARSAGFDIVLAHNAEAALVALAARRVTGVPVVYVAHTLLGVELSAYAPARAGRLADALGARLDAAIARRADGVVALSAAAAERLGAHARGPVALVPPGLTLGVPPAPREVESACAAHGLAPRGFALYAGNLDAYQELDALATAAGRIAPVPLVVATHDRVRPAPSPLRVARVASAAEARLLTHGAAVCVLARRRVGGFPVKLLNYLEAARPVVARADIAEGLVHARSGWLVAPDAPDAALGDAVARLLGDSALAARLGVAGRRLLDERHGWEAIARATLDLAARAAMRASPPSPPTASPRPDAAPAARTGPAA